MHAQEHTHTYAHKTGKHPHALTDTHAVMQTETSIWTHTRTGHHVGAAAQAKGKQTRLAAWRQEKKLEV